MTGQKAFLAQVHLQRLKNVAKTEKPYKTRQNLSSVGYCAPNPIGQNRHVQAKSALSGQELASIA
jgi:RIO-like serine/threonine protein kinase